ncbi:MAG: hypothetical protein HN350_18520 [Phycisphaerales bacterium]|jgi:hypothetical protein|nr:hypothetical protein [Phycisphaerales bacterium]
MKLRCIICLLSIIAAAPQSQAQTPDKTIQAQLQTAQAENKTLRKLVSELTTLNKGLSAEVEAMRQVMDKIEKDKLKTAAKREDRTMDYKLVEAENKMPKAKIRSLLKSGGKPTTRPAAPIGSSKHVRQISISLPEDYWEWWLDDPNLLTEHITLRRKLTPLDVDHSIDAWLTRRNGFAGKRVKWTLKLVSGAITSKEKVDKALKKAKKDLDDTLGAAVYGKSAARPLDNSKYQDRRIAARVRTQPVKKPTKKAPKINEIPVSAYTRPTRTDLHKKIRDLQQQIELYQQASKAGGITTIHAVGGNIAVKMSLPGKRFEKLSLKTKPSVQIVGHILSASPKAGYFAGRKDNMIQFVVTGSCNLTQPKSSGKSQN